MRYQSKKLRLFKNAQMQGVQEPGREAYLVYVERRSLQHNVADGRFSTVLLIGVGFQYRQKRALRNAD